MDDKRKSDEDAYKDLLDTYAREEDAQKKQTDLHNMVERHSSSGKKQFQLDIKDLDSEFTNTKGQKSAKTKSVIEERNSHGIFYRPEATSNRTHTGKKRTVESSPSALGEVSRRGKKEPERRDGFTYDEEFGPIITRGRKTTGAQSEPLRANTQNARNSVPAQSRNGRHAVILKKGDPMPDGKNVSTGNKIADFFIRNKKAWITVGICVLCAILLSNYLISCMNDVLAIHRDNENVISVTIPAETDTDSVIDILKTNGLIKHKVFCKIYAKAAKYRDDNYMSGIYYITKSMGVEKMLSTFKSPPATGETVTLAFPEGYTVDQIVEKLAKYEVCDADAMYKALKEVDFSTEYSFIKEEPNKEQRYRALEGYLYPDTYEFYKGENASSVIRTFLNNFQKKWTDEYQAKADALNMSVDDVVKLASIIEKEAANAEQMPVVSSVLHNRLNKSGLYPSLQCDSTTDYIADYITKNVTNTTELTNYTNRYSTYRCEGLPVGAICNPGDDSINAALNPSKTDYYFFAHDSTKKIYLARNDSEQQSNKIAILQANQKAAKEAANG